MADFEGPLQLRRFTAGAAAASALVLEDGRAFWVETQLFRGDGTRTVAQIYAAELGITGARDYAAGLRIAPWSLIVKDGIIYQSVTNTFTTTNWGADAGNFTAIGIGQSVMDAALALKADLTSLPKRYQFTGDGGNTTGTIGANTFPMAVTVTNPGTGDYHFTAASGTPFTTGKTAVGLAIIDGSNPLAWKIKNISSSEIEIEIYNTIDGTNTDPQNYVVTIQTEP